MRLLFLPIILFFACSLTAQQIIKPEIMLSGNYSGAIADFTIKQGFGAGFGVYFFAKRDSSCVGLRFGLEFQRINFSSDDTLAYSMSAYDTDIEIHANYFRIPLLFPVYLGRAERFFIEPGIYGAFSVNSFLSHSSGGYSNDPGNFGEPIPSYYIPHQTIGFSPSVGVQLGIGTTFPAGSGALSFRVDASAGAFGRVQESSWGYDQNLYINRVFRLSAIYRFPKNKNYHQSEAIPM